ncbi:MAG TPA: endolytic transglycosylase MltG [Longimicrobiales bacterium]
MIERLLRARFSASTHRGRRPIGTLRSLVLAAVLLPAVAACGDGSGEIVRVRVPSGATFSQVADSLESKGILRAPTLFRVYARITGADRNIKPGTYGFRRGTGWKRVLDDLHAGRVLTMRFVIPEGWDLRKIAPRLAVLTSLPEDSVLAALLDPAAAARFGVPGPTLEGYLYPATYIFPVDRPLDSILARLTGEYKKRWTPARQARADSIGMTEREVVTLASIVEKEAKVREEMPLIAAVYHNRLRIGYPLQADPTVQYALGEHQTRLLYDHINSVADNPYNTYHHAGLPPGPIASPSEQALDAALYPADVKYLYFVARPDGRHVFTRSLAEHNRAKAAVRRGRSVSAAPATGSAQPAQD